MIRISDHRPGDLGIDAARNLALRETTDGWQLVSRDRETSRHAKDEAKPAMGPPPWAGSPGAATARQYVGIADRAEVGAWIAALLSF